MTDDWLLRQEAGRYSMWLVATLPMRPEHRIVALKRFGANTYGHIHVTVQKWDTILTGYNAFLEVFESIKHFERRYPQCAEWYSIILHGRKGTPLGHTKYMLGCYVKYEKFTGELKISHINRKVEVFIKMVHTARFYGASFEKSDETEQRVANLNQRMAIKRVFRRRN